MRLLLAFVVMICSALALAGSCTHTPAAPVVTMCTPGDNIFCRCRGGAAGTKLCLADGQSFGPCELAQHSCDEASQGGGGAGGSGGAGQAGTGGATGGAGGAGGSGGSSSGGSGGAPSCHVVVNEVQTGSSSSAADEFVELFNPCPASVNLTGWKLAYRSVSGTSDFTLLDWSSGAIPSEGYLLIVGSAWSGGPPDATFANGGLAAVGGGVGLRDPTSALVDSMGYGSATNEFVEGSAPSAPSAGTSVGRSPNGWDTNQNAADFAPFAVPTPGAPNG